MIDLKQVGQAASDSLNLWNVDTQTQKGTELFLRRVANFFTDITVVIPFGLFLYYNVYPKTQKMVIAIAEKIITPQHQGVWVRNDDYLAVTWDNKRHMLQLKPVNDGDVVCTFEEEKAVKDFDKVKDGSVVAVGDKKYSVTFRQK